MVNVTHDTNNRSTFFKKFFINFSNTFLDFFFLHFFFNVCIKVFIKNFKIIFCTNFFNNINVDKLVYCCHNPLNHKELNNISRSFLDFFSQFADSHSFVYNNRSYFLNFFFFLNFLFMMLCSSFF